MPILAQVKNECKTTNYRPSYFGNEFGNIRLRTGAVIWSDSDTYANDYVNDYANDYTNDYTNDYSHIDIFLYHKP